MTCLELPLSVAVSTCAACMMMVLPVQNAIYVASAALHECVGMPSRHDCVACHCHALISCCSDISELPTQLIEWCFNSYIDEEEGLHPVRLTPAG